MPAVYLIGGGPLGSRVLEWAEECGLERIVTDRDPEAPGLREAEVARVIDGADVQGHLRFLRELRGARRIAGVYCGAEFGVRTVNRLNRELDLPSLEPSAVDAALDKPALKERLRRAELPTPPSWVVHDEAQLREIVRAGGTWVIKPASGSGSRGVLVLAPGEDCAAALAASRRGMPGESAWLVEPFREARSIDANGCFLEGRFHPCGVLEKFATHPPDGLPIGGYDPLPFGSGINPVRFLFRHFASGELALDELESARPAYATWRVIALPPGRILRRSPARLRAEEATGITCAWLNPRLTKEIPRYTSTVTIPGYVCARGREPGEAERALERWFREPCLNVEPDPVHARWYRMLGERLREVGFSPQSCGFSSAPRAA
jgi:hypothetical protein